MPMPSTTSTLNTLTANQTTQKVISSPLHIAGVLPDDFRREVFEDHAGSAAEVFRTDVFVVRRGSIALADTDTATATTAAVTGAFGDRIS